MKRRKNLSMAEIHQLRQRWVETRNDDDWERLWNAIQSSAWAGAAPFIKKMPWHKDDFTSVVLYATLKACEGFVEGRGSHLGFIVKLAVRRDLINYIRSRIHLMGKPVEGESYTVYEINEDLFPAAYIDQSALEFIPQLEVRMAVDALPQLERLVIRKYYWDRIKFMDIASSLHTHFYKVKQYHNSAIQHLREALTA